MECPHVRFAKLGYLHAVRAIQNLSAIPAGIAGDVGKMVVCFNAWCARKAGEG